LAPGEAHVWSASATAPAQTTAALVGLLHTDERTRAERFHRDVDRERYIVSRGALRILLSRYMGIPPAALAFAYAAFGKPEIAAGTPGAGIAFNVSHSGEKVLLAFDLGPAVGIDIEAHRSDVDVLELSRMVFADAERARLADAHPEIRRTLFYRTWARKEAVLKGCGTGLSGEPKCIVVLGERETADGLVGVDAGARFGIWGVRDIDAGEGFSAAVALPGNDWRARSFVLDWTG